MAKRANGEGTKIAKVPDRDLYKARYTDAGGKRRTMYGRTKGEVRKKLTEGLADRDKGRHLAPQSWGTPQVRTGATWTRHDCTDFG